MTNENISDQLSDRYSDYYDDEGHYSSIGMPVYNACLGMADFKDAQPISKLGGWDAEPPTADCKVLLETESKHEPYVVAGWSTHDKCFYDSNEQKYTKWKRWKKI